MTEIVINKCYGGFGISNKALMKLIKMKSSAVEKTLISEYYGFGKKKILGKTGRQEYEEDKKELKAMEDGYFEKEWLGIIYDNKYVYDLKDKYGSEKIRSHPDLIKVVKELGEEANGQHAKLKIIEIPDNIDFEIEEYDGQEWISEKHRTWG